jgi:hypothetical protein
VLAGTTLRKQRTLGEVLTDSFTILFAHWRQLAVISVPVVVANLALALVLLAITDDAPTAEGISTEGSDLTAEELSDLLLVLFTLLIAVPVIFVLQQLVAGGSVVYLDETDKGNLLSPADALDRAQANLGRLVGASLRAAVIVFLFCATVIGIPWGIYRLVRWVFLAQVIMIEDLRGQEVLARSASLVQGRWWNTFARLIVVVLVISLPVGLLQEAFYAAAPGVIGTILASATGFITVPFGIIGLSLMFFDLRARRGRDDSDTLPIPAQDQSAGA